MSTDNAADFSVNFIADLNAEFIENEELQAIFQEEGEIGSSSYGEYTRIVENDYDELIHKPQINSVELTGDKTSEDLHLQEAMNNLSNEEIEALIFA